MLRINSAWIVTLRDEKEKKNVVRGRDRNCIYLGKEKN
jgi:hypothetical protein